MKKGGGGDRKHAVYSTAEREIIGKRDPKEMHSTGLH